MARGEGGREREGARAWRRLIGQEIKLGLGEMGKWEAEEGEAEKEGRERERAGARMHTNTQFPTLVLIRRTLLLPLPLLPSLSHTSSSLLPAPTLMLNSLAAVGFAYLTPCRDRGPSFAKLQL